MQRSSSKTNSNEPPVEDVRFRREILLFAQQMLQNIDSREEEISRFESLDQPAYRDWMSLHFRKELSKIAKLEKEHAAAIQFHNSMVAVAKMQKVSMPKAFLHLKSEEETYKRGSLAQRRRIDEERQMRESFLRKESLGPPPASQGVVPVVETEKASEDDLRQVYRKLVRRLHPDLQGPGLDAVEQRWQSKVWHTAQKARQRGDATELQRLYKVTLLRQLEFTELTIADAHDICAFLKQELDRLTVALDQVHQSPAYGFHQLEDLTEFREQMALRMSKEIAGLEVEIKDLKGQHAYVEVLSHTESKAKRARRREAKQEDKGQLSLFDVL